MSTQKGRANNRLVIAEDMTIYNSLAQKQLLIESLARQDVVELDLSGVGEIDSAGFQLLVLIKREAARLGKTASIVAHSQCVQEVLDFLDMAADFGDPILIPSDGNKDDRS